MRLAGAATVLAILGTGLQAEAEESASSRRIAAVLARGDEVSIAHLGEELGPAALARCLESGPRSSRLLCAHAARFSPRPWALLAPLVSVLRDHDRELAVRAAESLATITRRLEPEDLGRHEALPSEVETLLRALTRIISEVILSPDVRALSVEAAGSLARAAGAGREAARAALDDDELAVRRAAVAALVGSGDAEDISSLGQVASSRHDLAVSALAAAGVCEVTAGEGRPIPSEVEDAIERLLGDDRARPSVIGPVLACLARSSGRETERLRELAGEQPNEASRAMWDALVSGRR